MAEEKILIVEDEGMIAQQFRITLEKWGFTVFLAKTGEEAIQLAGEVQPALVLMDIRLIGEMNGVEAAGQIRSQGDIPIVYLTAYADDEVLQQAKITGPYGYLVKPVQNRELRSTIEMALYRHELDRQYREQLETLVKERTAELKNANDELNRAYEELKNAQTQLIQSGRLASIGELTTGLVHELNQPLMVIRGNAQLVRRNLEKGDIEAETLIKLFEPIERNTKRMMNILNHLRVFSRQSQMEHGPVNVNRIIEDSFLFINEHLRTQNIVVRKELHSDLPPVCGDANQLEQVFLNLIINAREAIEAKGKKEQGNIDIISRIAESDNTCLEILIRDTGNGIRLEFIEKIFDPFFTTKEVGKGMGFGLSISYGIIKDHQGDIEVVETSPEGTTFRVKLPVLIED